MKILSDFNIPIVNILWQMTDCVALPSPDWVQEKEGNYQRAKRILLIWETTQTMPRLGVSLCLMTLPCLAWRVKHFSLSFFTTLIFDNRKKKILFWQRQWKRDEWEWFNIIYLMIISTPNSAKPHVVSYSLFIVVLSISSASSFWSSNYINLQHQNDKDQGQG